MKEKEKCQEMYYNTILYSIKPNMNHSIYLREFIDTEKCDQSFHIKVLRDDIYRRIEPERLHRIKKFRETNIDKGVAKIILNQEIDIINSHMMKHLTWNQWLSVQLHKSYKSMHIFIQS